MYITYHAKNDYVGITRFAIDVTNRYENIAPNHPKIDHDVDSKHFFTLLVLLEKSAATARV